MFESRSSLLAVAVALLVGATPSVASAVAQSPTSPPALASGGLQADPALRFGTLPNGMHYVIMRNATPRGEASLRLRIDAGSLFEAENQRGIAHFLEHMVLNGTTNVPEGEFVRRLERHGLRFGPDTNASTGFTQTVYKLQLPETDNETVDTALYLLREVVDEATLATSAIDSERGIILSEERTRSSPAYRVLVDELGYMMPGQRVPERLPIGIPEIIRTAPRERLVEFYNAYYRPERATFIAVGDFDMDAMEAKIRSRFESWRGEGAAGAEPELGAVRERALEARAIVEPGGSERVSIGWMRQADHRPDTRATRIDKLADRLALSVLGYRLERIAATAESPPFISARTVDAEQADSAAITQISASVRPGEWRPALQVLDQEQRRLVAHGVTAAELDRELTRMRTALAAAAAGAATRHSSRLSDALVQSVDDDEVFTTPAADLALFDEARASLTGERIHAAARALFAGEGPLLYMSSARPVEGAEAAMLAAYRESTARPVAAPEQRQAVAWPYTSFGTPGRVVERREHGGEIGATSVRFANGVWLTVKQTDFADDEILVSVRTGDGRGDIPAGTVSPNWALGPGFVMGGLRRISFEDMRDALTGRVVGLQTAYFDDSFALNGRTRPQDFATQMQMLAAYVAEPAWRPSGWDRIRANAETLQARYRATPDGMYDREAAWLLHNRDSRWAAPTLEQMRSSSIEDARRLLADALAREPIEIVIVGDVSIDEAIAQTAATFGALPDRIAEPDRIPPARFAAPTAEPIRLTHLGRPDQALAMIAWPTAGALADTSQTRLTGLLADVFRLRLTQRIREELGTTYSPVAMQVHSTYFDDFGFVFGRIEAPPEKLDEFLAEAAAISADLAANPISEDELRRARQPVLEGIERGRTLNSWWQINLTGLYRDPRVERYILDQRRVVEAITPASLQETARRFLRPDTAWRLVIVPEATGNAGAPSPGGG